MRQPMLRFAARWLSVIVLAPVLWAVTMHPPYLNNPAIRSDGLGYHAWTRAFVQRDFTFCRWPDLRKSGAITGEVDGRCVEKYPYGLGLLRLPVMGPLVNARPSAPEVSPREHRASLYLSAMALLIVCALATATLLLLDVEGLVAQLAVLTVVFGTGLFHYATYDSSFTHIYSAALAAALLLVSVWTWKRDRHHPPLLAVGLLTFFAVAVRSTNVFLTFGILGGVGGWLACQSEATWRPRLRRLSWWMAPAVIGTVVATGIEVAYLYYATHRLGLSGYGSETFVFNRPMQRSVLLSYERGLFTWYPIVLVVLAAGLLVPKTRLATSGLAGLIAIYVVIYGFWDNWPLGGGFGHRGFVDLAPLMMVILAVALVAMPKAQRTAAATAAVLCAAGTLSLMAGYWQGTIKFGGTRSHVYWSHLLGSNNLYRRWLRARFH